MFKRFIIRCAILCGMMIFFAGCVNQGKQAQSLGNKQESNGEKVYQLNPPVKGDKIAIINTDFGSIKVRLFSKEVPKAVSNFEGLSKRGYYVGTIFHRVIKDFMVQGGDPKGNGTGGESMWGKPFEDEINSQLIHLRGALAMANRGPNTNGSQFYIVQASGVDKELLSQMGLGEEKAKMYQTYGGTPWLDGKYTIFGQVFEGMDIVDKIADSDVGEGNKPLKDIKITSIVLKTMD